MLIIKIDHPLKPFSHAFHTRLLVPDTEYMATIAPGLLRLENLIHFTRLEVKIFVEGPISQFTVESELLNKRVTVFMQTKGGYCRYVLFREEDALYMHIDKTPTHGIRIECNELDKAYFKGEQICVARLGPLQEEKTFEQISFGCFKAQDVEFMRRRKNPSEFIPLILTLANVTPKVAPLYKVAGCFERLPLVHKESDPKKLDEELVAIYYAAFESLLLPRSNDTDYQGLTTSLSEDNPLAFLSLFKEIVLEFLCRFEGGHLSLLSQLPHSFDAGKIIGLKVPFGSLDMEWSRRKLRCLILNVEESFSFYLSVKQGLKKCRIRSKIDPRGKVQDLSEELHVVEGTRVFFDKFTK